MNQIYLDHNATTPMHPRVLGKMLPYFVDIYGNASSVHQFGQKAHEAMDAARESVRKILSANKPEEIIFTGGGTEADNLAIKGVAFSYQNKGNHIITSAIEHHAVLNTCKYLEKQGFTVTYLPVDQYGWINPDDVKKAITPKTILITIMHANNEVGTIQPIEDIGKIAKEYKVLFHTDAVQTMGKLSNNVNEMNLDLLSLSAHKLYGPKGVGALFVRKGTKLQPLIHGGHHEKNLRAGTENVAGIVGLGAACEIAMEEMERDLLRLSCLATRLYQAIKSRIPDVKLNGHPVRRLPGTMNISFKFIEGESIVLGLDMEGIAVSTGSACTSGSLEPSHVLLAMGLSHEIAQGSIRFSLGRGNTEAEMDTVVEVLDRVVSRMRKMSPLAQGTYSETDATGDKCYESPGTKSPEPS
ncbi:MAG: cysteine desulfurase NifS [bacterium]